MALHDQPQRTVINKDPSLRAAAGFTQIPTAVLRHQKLSARAKTVYAVLLSYSWQRDFCFPAQDRLADDTAMSVRHVQRCLDELKALGAISVKRQGLNLPNLYAIEPLIAWLPPEPSEFNGEGRAKKGQSIHGHDNPVASGHDNMSYPDMTPAASQEATPASYKEDPSKNTHKVVNDVTANDREQPKGKPTKPGRGPARISDPALRATYGLADEQIGRVHWLVEKQAKTLGHVDRNHAAYVKRAAEAVRDGIADRLDFKLGDFTQAATGIAVASRPAYFHAMWTEEAAAHTATRSSGSTPRESGGGVPREGGLEHLDTRVSLARMPADLRGRLIEYAAAQGHAVPAGLAHASAEEIARWYDGLPTADTQAG